MIIRKELNLQTPLTNSQKKMLSALETRLVTPDEDCPELTEEQLSKFRRIAEENRAERRKQTVTLRISQQALRQAKSLGKGYTSVLARILEDALNDTNNIRHYL